MESFQNYVLHSYSMITKRGISHYNQIKTDHKSNLLVETIENCLFVSLNGVGTTNFDPPPAVIEFLKKKEKRYRNQLLMFIKIRT